MGLPAARISDIAVGVCYCHLYPIPQVGFIITGSGTVQINGLGAARLTDIVLAGCGHIGIIVTSSGTVVVEGLGQARLSDITVGCFVSAIATGSPDTDLI